MRIPAAEIVDEGAEYRIVVEVPGAAKSDLEVGPGPVEHTLSLRIEAREERAASAKTIRNERNTADGRIRYERLIPVAWDADVARVRPALAEGLLTLVVPKRAVEKKE